jgi:antitoxin VapB
MPKEASMPEARKVSLFRNGRNQAVRIPVEFELPGDEALMRKEGDKLIIEPKRKKTLAEVLDEMEPLSKEEWPDVDDSDLLPLDDIEL